MTDRRDNFSAPAPRLEWLDMFRGLAVILMIETHSVNSFLKPELRQAHGFGWLNFLNGLVAPSFLFIAGYAQSLSMRKANRPIGWKKIRRLLAIGLIGYALHFTWTADIFHRENLQTISQVDILQCLAVSLLAPLAIESLAKIPQRIDFFIFVLLLAVVLGAPRLADWKSESPFAIPFAAYVNQRTGSLFPLFPWMGFALAGALASRIPLSQNGSFVNFSATFFGGGMLAGLGMWSGQFDAWTRHGFDAANPGFFFQRLGLLLALVPCFVSFQRRVSPPMLVYAGRESLALYVIHLLVLYGVFSSRGSLAERISCTKSWRGVLAMFAFVFAISFALTFLFSQRKRWKKI